MKREYILGRDYPGLKDRSILERVEGWKDHPCTILALPRTIPGEVLTGITSALGKVYQYGREDRSAELLPGDDQPRDYLRDLVHAEALDAVAQWGPGYADTSDDTGQLYVDLKARDDASGILVMTVSESSHSAPLKRFRVRVLIEEEQ